MKKTPMLLHICCAPCATHVLNLLAGAFELTGYFYNPNIHPLEEHARRLDEARRYCEVRRIPLLVPPYDPAVWFAAVKGLENETEGGARCALCFRMRLEAAARAALSLGLGRFGTTLTISPHKDAALVNRTGAEAGAGHGILFHEADFKKGDGYRESCRISAALGLYRQNYCGCIYSRKGRRDVTPRHP